MSSSDQAKSKLVDSMRMSKQGSGNAPVTKKATTATAPAKKAAPVKKAVAKKAKPAVSTKPQAAAKKTAPKKPITDNFQAAKRVWPD